ncbi:MAG: hypothetical protein ABIO86_20090 [Sphingomonas sp.]
MSADPVTAHLLRYKSGLCEGGVPSQHEVMATYRTTTGEAPFAFCRHGLLLDPEGKSRFLPFVEIADAGYYNVEMVKRAKATKVGDRTSEPLSIRLTSGEIVDLPMDVRDDGMPDLLNIAKLIHRRVIVHRASSNRAP